MDEATLIIIAVVGAIVAVWATVIAVAGALAAWVFLVRGYLGGTTLRLAGLSFLTLAFLPLGIGVAMLIGWLETRELNEATEQHLRRQ